jgi:para-nitrobenzyl esterase
MCIQPVPQGLPAFTSEDCLYLNIWAPAKASQPLPVMLFLHGGAFVVGSGILYDGGAMALMGNVIVVTSNYRLGSFGFFASPALLRESNTTGNYALQDQRASLEWIRSNIAMFGGNPEAITLFGESAGGASTCHHMVSPRSQGLLQRAIIQSGICHALPLQDVVKEISIPFTQRLNCSSARNDAELLECLRSLPAEQVLTVQESMSRPGPAIYLPWFPVIDGFELDRHPYDYIESASYKPIPVIIGTTRDEYSHFMCPFMNETVPFDQFSALLGGIFGEDFLPTILTQYHPQDYKYPVQWAIGPFLKSFSPFLPLYAR